LAIRAVFWTVALSQRGLLKELFEKNGLMLNLLT
jgi:hypothetical protein